jgi:hypothetical protein
MFEGKAVGHFCFWKQGDTANGAPVDCFTEANRPFVGALADSNSIDGETATLCSPRSVTTCVAVTQFSSKDCAPNGIPDTSLCGFEPGKDATCAKVGPTSSTHLCTNVCTSNFDCLPGYTCDTSATPRVCSLQ